eukprot:scaffold12720_cov152-Cylindrotheca_fusiformis.AAC.3
MSEKEEKQDERKAKAREEWAKFERVGDLLQTVNEYMSIYSRLKENDELIIVGSWGDQKPRHDLPTHHTEESWEALSLDEQYLDMMELARTTEPEMEALGEKLTESFGVVFKKGPLKGETRVKQKCIEDYDGDIRRVIDLVRCSFVIVIESLDQAKSIIDGFREGALSKEWELVRVKDGFEKPDNFLVGGYRDIKLNARYIPLGHLVECQLHLKPYLELKQNGGHEHYEFARQQKVNGITAATQILDMAYLPDAFEVGVEELKKTDDPMLKVEIMERLGDIKMSQLDLLNIDQHSYERAIVSSEAIYYYDQALRILKSEVDETLEESSRARATYCELLIGLSQSNSSFNLSKEKFDTYYNEEGKTLEVPEMLRPEFSDSSSVFGIYTVVSEVVALLGEKHPISLHAKSVRADSTGAEESVSYGKEVVEQMRSVLGYDHPMVANTLHSIFESANYSLEGEVVLDAFNAMVDVLEANLIRLGMHHSIIRKILSVFSLCLDKERHLWIIDAPNSKAKELARILEDPRWNTSDSPAYIKIMRYLLDKTVTSLDADKIQVGSRVAVWSNSYQTYYSGKVTDEQEEGEEGRIIFVDYDVDDKEWISPSRRHTILLSHGKEEPVEVQKYTKGDLEVGTRFALWYGGEENSYFTSSVTSIDDDTTVKVSYDTNEWEYIQTDDPARPFFVVSRNDPGSVEDVKAGDRIFVHWEDFGTYWLGIVLGPAEEENPQEHEPDTVNTKFRIQFYSGDLQVCDLNEMKFYPEHFPPFF